MLSLIAAEFLLCLLAAVVVGFLVAWFLRTRQVLELTAETERLRVIVPTGVLPSALSTRLELLARRMEELRFGPATESAAADLHRLLEAQQTLQDTVSELARRPPPTPPSLEVDVLGIERRLDALAQEIATLRSPLAAPPAWPRSPRPPKEERDDLILIHGVGPVLQRLLHRMGIYRFEQVMNWDANDIAAVSARLPNFKGRIEREGWVESARREYEKKYGHRSSEVAALSH